MNRTGEGEKPDVPNRILIAGCMNRVNHLIRVTHEKPADPMLYQ